MSGNSSEKTVSNALARAYVRSFSRKSDIEIFSSKVKEMVHHEIAHVLTTELIDTGNAAIFRPPVQQVDFFATHEVSGILGQIAGSEYPANPFLQYLILASGSKFTDLFSRPAASIGREEYVAAGRFVRGQLFLNLNLDDAVVKLVRDSEPSWSKPKRKLSDKDFQIPGVVADLKSSHYLDEQGYVTWCPILADGSQLHLGSTYSAREREDIYRVLIWEFDPATAHIVEELMPGIPEDVFNDENYAQAVLEIPAHALINAWKRFRVDLPSPDCVTIPEVVTRHMQDKYFQSSK